MNDDDNESSYEYKGDDVGNCVRCDEDTWNGHSLCRNCRETDEIQRRWTTSKIKTAAPRTIGLGLCSPN